MDHAIANVMRTAGLSLRDAVTLATRNPARVGRIPIASAASTPAIAPIWSASDWMTTGQLTILETYLSGQRVFPDLVPRTRRRAHSCRTLRSRQPF
jgi:N-acetylglucosamine-6-phosphate deacetylase